MKQQPISIGGQNKKVELYLMQIYPQNKRTQLYSFTLFLSFLIFFNIIYSHEYNLIFQDYQINSSHIELELGLNPLEIVTSNDSDILSSLHEIDQQTNNLNSSFIQIGENIHWYPFFDWNSSDEASFSESYRGHYNFQFIFLPKNQLTDLNYNQLFHGIKIVEGYSPRNPSDIVVNLQFKRQGFKLGDNISFGYYMDENFTILELAMDRLGISSLNASKFIGFKNFKISGFYQIFDDGDLKSIVDFKVKLKSQTNGSGYLFSEYKNYINYIFSLNEVADSIIENNFSKKVIDGNYDVPFSQKIVFTRNNFDIESTPNQISNNIKALQSWILNNNILDFSETKLQNLGGKYAILWKNITNFKNLQSDVLFFLIPIYISLIIFIFLMEKIQVEKIFNEYKKRYLLGEKPRDFFKNYTVEKLKIKIIHTFLIFILNLIIQCHSRYSDYVKETLKENLLIYFTCILILPIIISIVLFIGKVRKAKKNEKENAIHYSEEINEIQEKLKIVGSNFIFGIIIFASLIPIFLILSSKNWVNFQSPEIDISITTILIISFGLIFIIPIPFSQIFLNFISILIRKMERFFHKAEKSLNKQLILPKLSKFFNNNTKGSMLLIFLITNILLSGFYLDFEREYLAEKEKLKWDSATIKIELRYSEDFNYAQFIESDILSLSGIKSEYYTNFLILNQIFVVSDSPSNRGMNCSILDSNMYINFIKYSNDIQLNGLNSNISNFNLSLDNNSIIISKALADKKNLKIGDFLKISSYYDSSINFHIVGIVEHAPLCQIDAKPYNVHIFFLKSPNFIFRKYTTSISLYLKTNSDFNYTEFSHLFLNHYKQIVSGIEIRNFNQNDQNFSSLFLPRLYQCQSIIIGIVLIFYSFILIRELYDEQLDDFRILESLGCPPKKIKDLSNQRIGLYFVIIIFGAFFSFLILSFLFYKILLFKSWIQFDSKFYMSWSQVSYIVNNYINWDLEKSYGKSIMIFYQIPKFSIYQIFLFLGTLMFITHIQYKRIMNENAKSNIVKS